MKWFIGFISLILSTGLEAQTTAISVIENPVISNLEEIQERMSERQAVVDYQFVNIDLNSLQTETSIHIVFYDVDVVLYRDRLVRRNSESFSWFGFSEDKSTTVIFTVTGTIVNVSLLIEIENFKIETIEGYYVLERFDLSLLPVENCSNVTIEEHSTIEKSFENNETLGLEVERSEEGSEGEMIQCKLRVLVLYTNKAKQANSNIENEIRAGMDELNLSFANSNITGRAELVYVGETEYVEQISDVVKYSNGQEYVAVSKNLNNFQGVGDGHMDNVHVLRD